MFSRASWLERIHNNAGRPIYADQPPTRRPAPRQPPRPFPRANSIPFGTAPPAPYPGAAAPTPPPAAPPAAVPPAAPVVAVKPMSAPALVVNRPPAPAVRRYRLSRQYRRLFPSPSQLRHPVRPLRAHRPLMLRRPQPSLHRARPLRLKRSRMCSRRRKPSARSPNTCFAKSTKPCRALHVSVHDGLVSLGNPREFAVILASPKDVRLGLDLGDRQPGVTLVRAKIPGASPRITHMMILTDVRQLDAAFADLVRAADLSAKSRSAA